MHCNTSFAYFLPFPLSNPTLEHLHPHPLLPRPYDHLQFLMRLTLAIVEVHIIPTRKHILRNDRKPTIPRIFGVDGFAVVVGKDVWFAILYAGYQ